MVRQMEAVPADSIYMWMYRQGLRKIPWEQIVGALLAAGKQIRKKDEQNYWNGWYRSYLREDGEEPLFQSVPTIQEPPRKSYFEKRYFQYPPNDLKDLPDSEIRYVPCNADNKPMCQWSKEKHAKAEAEALPGQVYLAENNKGIKQIIIDVDGDHDEDSLDMQTISFFNRYRGFTHTLSKPKPICAYPGYASTRELGPASYHLTWYTDRIIPTMHFPEAHVDIIGNEKNSLRYFKNKKWNGLDPKPMDDATWERIKAYLRRRVYGK
jgi:hypothetical protein